MLQNILIYMSNFNFDIECNEVIEYNSAVHHNCDIMIPDDYIEQIRHLLGNNFWLFSNFKTYPDNWGCHKMEIVSFIFSNRYCELSEMFSNDENHLSIRIYPVNYLLEE
jgi:hypothetical protein